MNPLEIFAVGPKPSKIEELKKLYDVHLAAALAAVEGTRAYHLHMKRAFAARAEMHAIELEELDLSSTLRDIVGLPRSVK